MNFTRTKRLLLGSVVAVLPLSAAADDIFLKLDGVRGESIDARHRDEIDVFDFAQSIAGPFARSAPGGASAGKTVCGPVTILKFVDVASPDLILYAANGRHLPKAEFTFRRSGQQGGEYYKVILEDVIIIEVAQSNARSNSSRAQEKVSLMGRTMRFEYTATTQTGAAGARPKAGWDCAANAKV